MLRVITLNLNGIRSAVAQGLSRVARATAGRFRVHAGDQGAPKRPHWCNPHARTARRAISISRRRRATAASACTAAARLIAVSTGFGSREFDTEGRYLRADFGASRSSRVYLPSGSSSAERQQAKFRFLAGFLPALERLRASGREIIALRRLEHRAPRDRPEELAVEPEELRVSARGARMAHARVRARGLGRRLPHASTRVPSSTPGGRTAARRGRRTSAGGSTTRSRRPASPRARSRRRSTRRGGSPTTRR